MYSLLSPLVSIIALCYNHARFVEDALQSVVEQTYPHIELLIVDDASTDESVAHIRNFLGSCPLPARFFPLSENRGNCSAFNHAFAHSNGAFIIDLATDDRLLPTRVAEQVAAFAEREPHYGVVFSDVELLDEAGHTLGTYYAKPENVPSGDMYQHLIAAGGLISAPSMMIRREVLEALGGYDPRLAYEDYDFWVRSSRNYYYAFLNRVLTQKRVVRDSLTHQFYQRRSALLESTLRVCRKAQQLNQSPAEDRALARSVRYHLRQSVFTGQFSLAKRFAALRNELVRPCYTDRLWDLLWQGRIPLFGLYRLYQAIFIRIK